MFNTLGNSIPRNGLVGEWLLDGNALDTASTNNGTATNVVYVKTDKGYQSQAGSFNGSSSFITSGFPTQVANVAIYTSLWIKRAGTGSGTNNCIIQFGNTQNNIRFGFWINSSNQLGIWNSGGGPTYSTIVPTLNKWEHYIFGRDGTNVYIYKNSQLVYSVANSSNDGASVIAAMRMGQRESNSGEFYNGQLQGVMVYNRILSQDEITLLYREGQRLLGPTNIAKYPALLSGLTGYWDMKGTAHNLVDGTLATVTGATLTQDRFGNSNSAYSFDGINDFIGTNITTGLSLSFSFNLWIKTNTSAYQSLIHSHVASYNNLWTNVSVDSGGKIRFQMFDGTNNPFVDSTIFINDNNWHLITCERNVISDKLRIYIDGNYNNETTDTTTSTPTYSVFNLGVRGDGTKTGWYNGQIGDCFFFNRAFSADEIKTLYDLTSQDYIYPTPSYDIASLRDGLVLDLNEQGFDLSGNGNNGTLVNSPVVVRQGRAKGLSYNGSNQYVLLTNNNALKPNSTNTIYFSCGIKTSQVPTVYGTIATFGYENGVSGNSSGFIALQNNGTIRLSGNGTNVIDSTISVNDGKYHRINIKLGASAEIWIDGVLRGSGSLTFNSGYSSFAPTLGTILYGSGSPQYYYSGQIFNPRINNTEIGVKKIQEGYYSQKGNFIY